MNEAITAIDKLFNSDVEQIVITNSLTFTILELVSKLSAHKEYIQERLKDIRTTLEEEEININNENNKKALRLRPVTASRPVTRRGGRQNGGNKSKLNSTRKKKLKN
jgi:predicted amino acid-binding ACT domain protein